MYVRNQRRIHAPAERVWAWLVRAPLWPSYLRTAKNVHLEGGLSELAAGVRFTWNQLGQQLESEVAECEPPRRLGWFSRNRLIQAYHVWDVRSDGDDSLVTTDEAQHGFLPATFPFIVRPRMLKGHELWLDVLEQQASAGPPP